MNKGAQNKSHAGENERKKREKREKSWVLKFRGSTLLFSQWVGLQIGQAFHTCAGQGKRMATTMTDLLHLQFACSFNIVITHVRHRYWQTRLTKGFKNWSKQLARTTQPCSFKSYQSNTAFFSMHQKYKNKHHHVEWIFKPASFIQVLRKQGVLSDRRLCWNQTFRRVSRPKGRRGRARPPRPRVLPLWLQRWSGSLRGDGSSCYISCLSSSV